MTFRTNWFLWQEVIPEEGTKQAIQTWRCTLLQRYFRLKRIRVGIRVKQNIVFTYYFLWIVVNVCNLFFLWQIGFHATAPKNLGNKRHLVFKRQHRLWVDCNLLRNYTLEPVYLLSSCLNSDVIHSSWHNYRYLLHYREQYINHSVCWMLKYRMISQSVIYSQCASQSCYYRFLEGSWMGRDGSGVRCFIDYIDHI